MGRRLVLASAAAAGLAACSLPAAGAPSAAGAGRGRLADPGNLTAHLAGLVERIRPALVQIRAGGDSGLGPRPPAAGFFVEGEGIVLTVAHVVDGVEDVDVELSDGCRLPARVIGRDPRTDLAALRVEGAKEWPALRLGDSDRVRAGELVLAFGHPYGLRQAVSLGIVSWMGPPPADAPPGYDFIHTDASVGRGHSGGPLVNLRGEVVGVHGWAARNGSMGIAVPAALVRLVLPRLIEDGRVEWDPATGSPSF
jgi:serine protease Do